MRRVLSLAVILMLVPSVIVIPAATAASASPAAANQAQQSATYEPCEFPVTMTDATGEEITLEERPDRVTTTNPSAAQTMWEIGGRSQVVGLTENAMYLDEASERRDVSAEFGVSVERVVATEPDLVLAPNASADDVEALREAGLTVYHFPEATDIDDIRRKTTVIGKLTGNCEGAAQANAWMDANVASVRDATADVEQRPRVLHPLGGGWVVGGGTFINAILELSGADNVAAREHTGYVQLSEEVVLELDPEILVLTPDTTALIDEQPYASTTAGQEANVVVLRTAYLHQPAPRSVVFSTHNATEQLHPELYSDDLYVPRSAITVESAQDQPGTTTETATPTTDGTAPGFGVQVALVGLLVGLAVLLRRR